MSGNKAVLVEHALTTLGLKLPTKGDIGKGREDASIYLECEEYNLAYKFKGWFYLCNAAKRRDKSLGLLVFNLVNCVNHWNGNHSNYALFDP